jgi:hypothetical protein
MESRLIFPNRYGNRDDFWINGCFTPSTESQTAGRALLKRRDARVKNRGVPINGKVQPAQFAALEEWANPIGERFAYLNNIKIQVLICECLIIAPHASLPSSQNDDFCNGVFTRINPH